MVGGHAHCHDFAMKNNRLPATAVMTAVLLLTSACGSAKDDDKGRTTTSSSPSPAATELIEYDQDDAAGVSVAKASDVVKLEGAPEDFKQFVAGLTEVSKMLPDDDCQFRVGVAKIDTSGFAAGSMGSCGGAMYIWAERDGVWQEIWSGQELPICADMKTYSVPKPIAGDKCYSNKDMTGLVDYSA